MNYTYMYLSLLLLVPLSVNTHPLIIKRSSSLDEREQPMKLENKKCKACEGGVDPLTIKQENEFLSQLQGWEIDRDEIHKIRAEFKWKNFKEAMLFVNIVADLAEEEGHHPNIVILYNHVIFELYTHAIKGLSENDFILAAKIDKVAHAIKPT